MDGIVVDCTVVVLCDGCLFIPRTFSTDIFNRLNSQGPRSHPHCYGKRLLSDHYPRAGSYHIVYTT